MTMLNRLIEGQYITSSDVGILNNLTIFQDYTFYGGFSIPVPNLSFLSGLFRLVKWDYSYFGGNAAILQFMLYSSQR